MDYENKYKEALKRAKDYHKQLLDEDNPEWAGEIENIFPELKESKDEKIRKVIRGWIYTRPASFFDNGISKEEILAWLENQGEQKPIWTDNDRTMTFTLLRDIDQITYISKEGKNERFEWLNSLNDRFKKE